MNGFASPGLVVTFSASQSVPPQHREVFVRRFFVLAAALLATFAMPASARAQTREVTGKVTVAGSGNPLQDAIVGTVGAVGGARTNERGEFRLRVPSGDVTVQVRAIGYKRQTVRVS